MLRQVTRDVLPAGRTRGYPGLAGHRDARGAVVLRAVAARRFLIIRRHRFPAVAHLQLLVMNSQISLSMYLM